MKNFGERDTEREENRSSNKEKRKRNFNEEKGKRNNDVVEVERNNLEKEEMEKKK